LKKRNARLGGARAAHGAFTVGLLGTDVVENFNQRHLLTRSSRSGGHGRLNVLLSARAARLGLVFNITSGLLANKFALRARAGGGLGARPRAFGFFTERSTGGFRGDTGGVAFSGGTDGFALQEEEREGKRRKERKMRDVAQKGEEEQKQTLGQSSFSHISLGQRTEHSGCSQ
jgi:hypothetical protein